ncbi:hypothetical protein MNBD_DELTA03-290 [hydrothermal vent metagenome]|uniref:Xylose isomerase-like TIM barrel domain-containing protein n=1 Tax=hydrothermal vent metagenome TaxID=652676 RepID=A0A3B0V9T1_9ZZZZ
MQSTNPRLLALFQKRIDGDDALLELARLRFQQAGLGTEFYASSPEELKWLLRFRPNDTAPLTVHLPRGINLLENKYHAWIINYMTAFAGVVDGFIIHDQAEVLTPPYQAALAEIDQALRNCPRGPMLFVEYAAGLAPAVFCELHEQLQDLPRVSACIDIGHMGIYYARELYRQSHPESDICALTPASPELPGLIDDIQNTVEQVLNKVLAVVRQLAGLGKALHFHLHDGHPLSTFSPFGVADHLSFFSKIPIPFAFKGKKELATMFGPGGLEKIIAAVTALPALKPLSFTLEIHPTKDRLPLGDAAYLFNHWRIKTNAEQMNHWLSVLVENHRLLSAIINRQGR